LLASLANPSERAKRELQTGKKAGNRDEGRTKGLKAPVAQHVHRPFRLVHRQGHLGDRQTLEVTQANHRPLVIAEARQAGQYRGNGLTSGDLMARRAIRRRQAVGKIGVGACGAIRVTTDAANVALLASEAHADGL